MPIAVTLYLVLRELPACMDARAGTRIRTSTGSGALLCALGLAGPVFALIEQPTRGWDDPLVFVPLVAGIVLLVLFVVRERRTPDPMMPLDLFRRHNFTVGNLATLPDLRRARRGDVLPGAVPPGDRRLQRFRGGARDCCR